MTKQQLATIEKKAAQVANNSIDFVVTEDRKGNITNRGINVDGRTYWDVDTFYCHYPETASKRWVQTHSHELLEHGWLYKDGAIKSLYE